MFSRFQVAIQVPGPRGRQLCVFRAHMKLTKIRFSEVFMLGVEIAKERCGSTLHVEASQNLYNETRTQS